MSIAPKTEKNGVPVVAIDIDDDADATASMAASETNNESSEVTPSVSELRVQLQQQKTFASSSPLSASNPQSLDSRSFWKAGDYVVGPSSKPAAFQGLAHLAQCMFVLSLC